MKPLRLISVLVAIALLASPAGGDWFPGDGYKMHYPQLPDPNGWDVRVTNSRRQPSDPLEWVVADDWRCSETGPVKDVHLWVSWMQEVEDQIVNLHLSIHDDDRTGAFSKPGNLLWEYDVGPVDLVWYGSGDQGWYDPPFDDWWRPDHFNYYQINIVDIPEPFIQQVGQIYWLDVSVDLLGEAETGQLGWKTSLDHFEDTAVYWDPISQDWFELFDPETGAPLEMAFVITIPEPAAVGLVMLAAAGGLVLRRRR